MSLEAELRAFSTARRPQLPPEAREIMDRAGRDPSARSTRSKRATTSTDARRPAGRASTGRAPTGRPQRAVPKSCVQ